MMMRSSFKANTESPRQGRVGRFGDKFRKEREKKEISLDDVSRVTKISSRMLQAIEEEQFDRLPGGVFNKGFIRAYAKHLGLNDEEAISEYLTCLHQEQIDAQSSWQPSSREGAPAKRPIVPMSKQPIEASEPTEKNSKSTLQPAAPAKAAPPQPAAQNNVELPELQLPRAEDFRPLRPAHIHSGQSGQGGMPRGIIIAATVILVLLIVLWRRDSHSSHAATSTTSAPAAQSSSAGLPQAGSAQSSGTLAATSATPSTDDENGDPNRPIPAKNRAAVKNDAPLLTLVIRASENSWISVSADGQTASQESLIAPAHTSVRASHDVVVKVGNAAGISFLFNGKEIPPQGGESEAQTFVFDSSGLKTAQSAPAAN
jgi:cytoskeleton protein RodZ